MIRDHTHNADRRERTYNRAVLWINRNLTVL